jgi:SHS2 domain-containing protein
MRQYELLDHTADIGIIAFGRDRPEAFGNAAYAMFDILTSADTIKEMDRSDLQVSASDIEELLVVWLDELLYRYETERLVFKRFIIDDMDDVSLRATVFGEKLDPARHEIKVEIKSVTYHQLKVERADDGWKVQVIFDV